MVTINLVRAHKYLQKLKQHVGSSKPKKSSWPAEKSVPFNEDPKNYTFLLSQLQYIERDTVSDKFTYLSELRQKRYAAHRSIISDIKHLKTLIYDTNGNVGLSKILTDIELLSEEKKFYVSLKDHIQTTYSSFMSGEKLASSYVEYLASDKKERVDISLCILSRDDIEASINAINKKISVLEDTRDQINSATQIQYQFSDESAHVLGL